MSLARMFLSGLLIAGGLILGVFALHGYLDPQWMQKQVQAAASQRERPAETQAINTFQNRNRFVATRSERQNPAAAPPKAKPETRTADEPPAAVKVAAKPPVKKKPVESKVDKSKPPPPQQATVQWPWNLFSN